MVKLPTFSPVGSDNRPLLYIGGSLKNRSIIDLHKRIEAHTGWACFTSWLAAHPDADDQWRDYERAMGFSYAEALYRPAGQNVFQFDKGWLDKADAFLLVQPAGKSGHAELGYMAGKGKPTFILMDTPEPDRFDVMAAFASKVFRNFGELVRHLEPCVEFNGATSASGYGKLKRGGRFVDAHRHAYVKAHGEIPSGLSVLHVCDNRRCWHVPHLSLGTQADNLRDAAEKGRMARKLTNEQVREIRRLHGGTRGDTARLAREFSVSATTVSQIVSGKRRQHVKTEVL